MENRRATRAAPPAEPPTTRRTTRGVSDARKSPTRKSPARKSPSRRAAAPVSSDTASARPASPKGRRGRAVAKKTDSESEKKSTDSSPKLAPLSSDIIRKATSRSTATAKTTITTSSTRVKVSNLDDEVNDNDVARITAKYVELARSKLSMSKRLTPTPSEISRHTHSMSRSIVDEEEYSDTEKEPLFESFKNDLYTYGTSSENYTSRNTAKQLPALSEFGGSLGALFWIVVIIVLGFSIPFMCTRQDCTGSWTRLEKLKEVGTFVNLESCYLYFGFIWALFLLSAIPLGRVVTISSDRGPIQYTFNGIVSGIFGLIALFIAEYLKYPAMKMLYRNYQQLAFLSIVYALILAGWCYLRSKWQSPLQWNSYAKSERFWADYFIGREINPRWFDLIDIKLAHYRVALVGALLFNSIFAYKTLKFAALPVGEDGNVTLTVQQVAVFAYNHLKFDAYTLLVSGLVCVYLIDLLVNEHHLTSSFELQGEGVGAMLLLRYALFPFAMSILSKYAFDHKLSALLPKWVFPLVAVFFIVGVMVKRRSSKLKYEYRLHPGNPKFSGKFSGYGLVWEYHSLLILLIFFAELETLPTFQGRRLIVSSYTDAVRNRLR